MGHQTNAHGCRRFFRRGDTVRLDPGGLPLTCTGTLPDGRVLVRWTSGGTTYRGMFEPWRLALAPTPYRGPEHGTA